MNFGRTSETERNFRETSRAEHIEDATKYILFVSSSFRTHTLPANKTKYKLGIVWIQKYSEVPNNANNSKSNFILLDVQSNF